METEQPGVPEQEQDSAPAETLASRLRVLVEYLADNREDELMHLAVLAIERINKQALILRTLFPDKVPGQYFICGASVAANENGLPDTLHVCPAYGADVSATQIYKRID